MLDTRPVFVVMESATARAVISIYYSVRNYRSNSLGILLQNLHSLAVEIWLANLRCTVYL